MILLFGWESLLWLQSGMVSIAGAACGAQHSVGSCLVCSIAEMNTCLMPQNNIIKYLICLALARWVFFFLFLPLKNYDRVFISDGYIFIARCTQCRPHASNQVSWSVLNVHLEFGGAFHRISIVWESFSMATIQPKFQQNTINIFKRFGVKSFLQIFD